MKNWKICIIFLSVSLLLLIPHSLLNGCGYDWDPEEDRFSLFSPYIIQDQTLWPYTYCLSRLSSGVDDTTSIERMNAQEWRRYLGNNRMSLIDIENLVYSSCTPTLDSLLLAIKHPKQMQQWISAYWKQNAMYQQLLRTKNTEAIRYLIFAKRCEKLVNRNEWDENTLDSTITAPLIQQGYTQWATSKHVFIKLRYGFQLTRLASYSGQNELAIRFCEQLVEPNPLPSEYKWQSVSLKAAVLLSSQRNRAAYLFSRVFVNSYSKRYAARMSLPAIKSDDLYGTDTYLDKDSSLSYCKNNHEKAELLVFLDFTTEVDTSLADLKKMSYYDVDNRMVELYVSRKINIVEDNIKTAQGRLNPVDMANAIRPYYTKDNEEYIEAEKQLTTYCKRLSTLCIQNIKTYNPTRKAFWYICASYLKLLVNDFNAARYLAQLAEQQKDNNPELHKQAELIKLLCTIKSSLKITPTVEEQILPQLQAMNTDNTQYKLQSPYAIALSELQVRYVAQHEAIKAALCSSVCTKYFYKDLFKDGQDTLINRLANFVKDNSTHTSFETFLIEHSPTPSQEEFINMQGRMLLTQGRYKEAVLKFQQLPTDFWDKPLYTDFLDANPFATYYADFHQDGKQDTVKYSPLAFAQKMVLYENLATTQPQKAHIYYGLLGNGCYNMSYWGNSWLLTSDDWSSTYQPSQGYTETYDDRKRWDAIQFQLISQAKRYYEKAVQTARNKEQAAKYYMLMAKCEQKSLKYDFDEMAKDSAYYHFLYNTTSFNTLFEKYKNTQFVKEVIKECNYLNDYIAARRLHKSY